MLLVCLKIDFSYSQEGQCSAEQYFEQSMHTSCCAAKKVWIKGCLVQLFSLDAFTAFHCYSDFMQ